MCLAQRRGETFNGKVETMVSKIILQTYIVDQFIGEAYVWLEVVIDREHYTCDVKTSED